MFLLSFYEDSNKVNNLNLWKGHTEDKKAAVHVNASEPYYEYLEMYYDQYMALSDARKKSLVEIWS